VLLDAVLGQSPQAQAAPEKGGFVMARSRSALKQIQRDTHLISRTAGDLSAASRGPVPLARRLARRDLTRALFRILRQMGK
jgi:hypothetical protein